MIILVYKWQLNLYVALLAIHWVHISYRRLRKQNNFGFVIWILPLNLFLDAAHLVNKIIMAIIYDSLISSKLIKSKFIYKFEFGSSSWKQRYLNKRLYYYFSIWWVIYSRFIRDLLYSPSSLIFLSF